MADTLELIKTLPPELREQISKEYIKIKLWQRKILGWDEVREEIHKGHTSMKLRQRKALGWDEVHAAIKEAPFCYRNEQIVRVLFCYNCDSVAMAPEIISVICATEIGDNHYLGYPIYDEDDYDEAFKKSFDLGWCGVVA